MTVVVCAHTIPLTAGLARLARPEAKDTIYDPTTDSFILDRAAYEKIVKEDSGRIVVVVMPYRKPWVDKWLRIPHMTVASSNAGAMSGSCPVSRPLSRRGPLSPASVAS